jgi:hypothetical protein
LAALAGFVNAVLRGEQAAQRVFFVKIIGYPLGGAGFKSGVVFKNTAQLEGDVRNAVEPPGATFVEYSESIRARQTSSRCETGGESSAKN